MITQHTYEKIQITGTRRDDKIILHHSGTFDIGISKQLRYIQWYSIIVGHCDQFGHTERGAEQTALSKYTKIYISKCILIYKMVP